LVARAESNHRHKDFQNDLTGFRDAQIEAKTRGVRAKIFNSEKQAVGLTVPDLH
jgi:hypothetical protein